MREPFFVVETPRAGKFNYRYIIPPGLTLTTPDVAGLIQEARSAPDGAASLSASRPTKQIAPNGAVREGEETIVLANVDVPRLTSDRRRRLRESMDSLLRSDVDRLVQGIEWNKEGQDMLVVRPELANWVRAEPFVKLPPAASHDRPPRPPWSVLKIVVWLGAAALLALAVVAVVFQVRGLPGKNTSHKPVTDKSRPLSPTEPGSQRSEDAKFRAALRKLAKVCDTTPDVLAGELWLAANPRRDPPAGDKVPDLLRSDKVRKAVEDGCIKQEHQTGLFIFVAAGYHDDLKSFFESQPLQIANAIDVRAQIARLGKAFKGLRDHLKKLDPQEQEGRGKFWKLIVRIGSLEFDEADQFNYAGPTRKSPLFDNQDEATVRLFNKLCLESNSPLKAALSTGDYESIREARTLPQFLRGLRDHEKKIQDEIKVEKEGEERKNDDNAAVGKKVKAFNNLKDFLEEIGGTAMRHQ